MDSDFWVLGFLLRQDKRPQPPTAITSLVKGLGPNMLQFIGELPGGWTSLVRGTRKVREVANVEMYRIQGLGSRVWGFRV